MKILKYITIFSLSLLIFSSCEDNLNTLPEGDILTSSQKEEVASKDPSKSEAGVNAIFSQLNAYMPNKEALGQRERDNDFGYPSIMFFTDANSADLVGETNGYNWMSNSIEYGDRDFASNEAQIVWNNLYSYIKTSNDVIETIAPDTDDPLSQYFLAQGLTMRAFSYNILAQLYQFKYKGNEQKSGVPLITPENSLEASIDGAKRAPLQEIYELVLSDLNKSVELLESSTDAGVTRKDKRYIDLAVAYGMRARINLALENWADAAADAQAAIDNSSATPATIADVSKPYFEDASQSNWMWGIIIAETDRTVTSGIVNWISHMGSINYGYANFSGGFQINKTLYESIEDTDVRKNWWLDENQESKNLTNEMAEFVEDYEYVPYTQVKFAPYKNEVETATNANDIPLMRIEEMYLILAEAQAMSGNASDGAQTLSSFIKEYRNTKYAFSGSSSQAVQEEVFYQRRIELWGEGLIWYDIKRLSKGVDRRGGGYQNNASIYNIAADDPVILWRIPEAEIMANPMIDYSDNNTFIKLPTPVEDFE